MVLWVETNVSGCKPEGNRVKLIDVQFLVRFGDVLSGAVALAPGTAKPQHHTSRHTSIEHARQCFAVPAEALIAPGGSALVQ